MAARTGSGGVRKVDTSGVLRLVAGSGTRPGWGVPVTGGAATSTDISVAHVAVGAGPVDPVDTNQQWFNRRVVINVRY